MELFTGLEQERLAPEAKTETSSRFGALVVVLVPFGIAAWVAIGFSMYRLIT